jgi:hypothetical protein
LVAVGGCGRHRSGVVLFGELVEKLRIGRCEVKDDRSGGIVGDDPAREVAVRRASDATGGSSDGCVVAAAE